MTSQLEQFLVEAQGKTKEEIQSDNPFREIGFDGDQKRLGWVNPAPFSQVKDALEGILPFLSDKEQFIFVAMGGSINGIKALIPLFSDACVYTLDSLDPAALQELLPQIKDPKKTAVISLSKSGTTKETQLLSSTLKEFFGQDWENHFLWVCDPPAAVKLDGLGWEGVMRVPIQPNQGTDIGGRFSSPNTLIFLLPLFILLKKDFAVLEALYAAYTQRLQQIRAQAFADAQACKDLTHAYFHPQLLSEVGGRLASWITQMFQESLGSKDPALPTKALGALEPADASFRQLELKVDTDDMVLYLLCQMYYYQVFVAYYSAVRNINFVTQEYVEKYKAQMRKLEGQAVAGIETYDLSGVIEQVKAKITPEQKFIEIVLFMHASPKLLEQVKTAFTKAFPDKRLFLFVGSDWNHHSYQAAFGDKYTFYVLVLSAEFPSSAPPFSAQTLQKNLETLKLISKATYVTIQEKAVLLALTPPG